MTTLHCINSAIVKMSRLAKPQTVYRGIAGRVLPAQFWRGAGHGGVEFAFMSTTADRTVAMQYAKGSQQSKGARGVRGVGNLPHWSTGSSLRWGWEVV